MSVSWGCPYMGVGISEDSQCPSRMTQSSAKREEGWLKLNNGRPRTLVCFWGTLAKSFHKIGFQFLHQEREEADPETTNF